MSGQFPGQSNKSGNCSAHVRENARQISGTNPEHVQEIVGKCPGNFREPNPGQFPWPPEGQTVKYRNRVLGLVVCEVSLSWRCSCCRPGSRYFTHLRAPHARCNGVFGHGNSSGHFLRFSGYFREMSWKCPGNVREMSGKFPGNVRQKSGEAPGFSRKCL